MCNTPKKSYSVQATSTPPRLTPLITTLPISPVELKKKLTPVGKEYLCFQVNRKSPHAAQCVKLRVLNKSIDSIISIDTFEQQCVVIKFMLQSSRLKDHTKTIGIDRLSFTRSYFEHRCMNNTKKIYQHAGKCDHKKNFKDILEDALLSTPKSVTDNSPNVNMPSTPFKKLSARNHCVYSQTYWMLNLKQKNVVLWMQNPNAKP